MSHLSTAQAIYKLLTDDPTLSAKVEGVFDVVPEGQKGPYIQIGELQSLRGRLLNDRERSWSVDLHVWSEYQGRREILEVADLIFAAMPTEWFVEELITLKDPSGWWHGVLTIRGFDR